MEPRYFLLICFKSCGLYYPAYYEGRRIADHVLGEIKCCVYEG